MKRDKIVKAAKSYLGTCEDSNAHHEIIHIFNTVKPDGYTAKVTDPWCAEFASAMAIQAYGKDEAKKKFPLSASCPVIIKKAKEMGIWTESDKYKPDKGDWVLYDWNDSGKGDNHGEPDHVGICAVITDNLIAVIEGNYGGMVKYRTLWVNGQYIRGYVTPDYDEEKKPVKKKKKKKKVDQKIIKAVLSGDYGSGEKRRKKLIDEGYDYDAIQREVTRITYLTKAVISGTYGSGKTRKEKLGSDYNIVQWNVNRVLKERKK